MRKLQSLLQHDSWTTGIVAVIATELPVALMVWVVLTVIGQPLAGNLRWLAIAFIAPALLLRRMAKRQQLPAATKGAIVTLFLTFLTFILLYLKNS